VNLQNGIRATPAGSEMNVRITGSKREKNTAISPLRSNQSWARSTSSGRISRYRPKRFTSGRPPTAPAQYASHEPTRFPAVPRRATVVRSSSWPAAAKVVLASAPPKSIVTSDGTGTHADSRTIRRKTAR
jgi:hypothetical protein